MLVTESVGTDSDSASFTAMESGRPVTTGAESGWNKYTGNKVTPARVIGAPSDACSSAKTGPADGPAVCCADVVTVSPQSCCRAELALHPYESDWVKM